MESFLRSFRFCPHFLLSVVRGHRFIFDYDLNESTVWLCHPLYSNSWYSFRLLTFIECWSTNINYETVTSRFLFFIFVIWCTELFNLLYARSLHIPPGMINILREIFSGVESLARHCRSGFVHLSDLIDDDKTSRSGSNMTVAW